MIRPLPLVVSIAALALLGLILAVSLTEESSTLLEPIVQEFDRSEAENLSIRQPSPPANIARGTTEALSSPEVAPATAPEETTAPPTVRLEVIELLSGTSIPGQRIFVLEISENGLLLQKLARQEIGALETLARASSVIVVSNETGHAQLPVRPVARWLCCEYGEFWGSAYVPADFAGDVRLELAPSVELRVCVKVSKYEQLSDVPVDAYEVIHAGGTPVPRLLDRGQTSYSGAQLRIPHDSRNAIATLPLLVRARIPGGPILEHLVTEAEVAKGEVVLSSPTPKGELGRRRSRTTTTTPPQDSLGEPIVRLMLQGRLLRNVGDPVATRPLSARIVVREGDRFRAIWFDLMVTREDGSFRAHVAAALTSNTTCHLELVLLEALPAEERYQVSIPFTMPNHTEVIPLGAHMLQRERMEVLASGSVVDDSGMPTEGARVTIGSIEIDELCGRAGPVRETLLPSSCAISDANGLFTLRGVPLEEPFTLHVTKERCFADEPVLASYGARNLVLQLVRGGSIEGRVLCDPDLDPRLVRVQIRNSRGPLFDIKVNESGGFLAEGLPPGELALHFDARGRKELEVTPLATTPGQTLSDVRLQPVDLRTEARLVDFVLRSANNAPLPHVRFVLANAEAAHGLLIEEATDAAGRAKVLLSGQERRWILGAERHVPVLFEESSSALELKLDRTRRVKVHFEPELELPSKEQGALLLRCAPPSSIPQTSHTAWSRLAVSIGLHHATIDDPQSVAIELIHQAEHNSEWVFVRSGGREAISQGELLQIDNAAQSATLRANLRALEALFAQR